MRKSWLFFAVSHVQKISKFSQKKLVRGPKIFLRWEMELQKKMSVKQLKLKKKLMRANSGMRKQTVHQIFLLKQNRNNGNS